MAHDEGRRCICVGLHIPKPVELNLHHILPLSEGGDKTPGNEIWVCPTTHTNVHELLRHFYWTNGDVEWEVLKRCNAFTRALAKEGWRRIKIVKNQQIKGS